MNTRKRDRRLSGLFVEILIFAVCFLFAVSSREVQAASGKFVTKNGKTYYKLSDGSYKKGWLELKGKKYFFDKTSGVMQTGWYGKNPKKYFFSTLDGHMFTGWITAKNGNLRYFYPDTGHMAVSWMTLNGKKYYFHPNTGIAAKGWVTNETGTRYFRKKTGVMLTGLHKIGNYYYYFFKKDGYTYKLGWGTVNHKKYYFSPDTGRAKTGWLVYKGSTYYFNEKGVMYQNTSVKINGKKYTFDQNGAAKLLKYEKSGSNVKVYCAGETYYLVNEYLTHPGIANGKVSDEELLAALIDCEASSQGLIGMEACALTILNRTIDPRREFPPYLRYVIYEGTSFPQYSPVRNGSLLKRLKGSYQDKTNAVKAAKAAIRIYNNYVTKGTKRTLKGFKTKDFNYLYFMTPEAFWSQNLNFSKVKYCIYSVDGDAHVFFEDWISG